MKDLARVAGVSPATVSRAFNPASAHLVKPATRARIAQLAQQLHYTPNRLASALSSGCTRSIAIIFPHTTHFTESTFDINALTYLVAALQPHGLDVKVHFLPPPPLSIAPQQLAAQLAVDGIIFAGIQRAYRLPPAHATSPCVVMLCSYAAKGYPRIDANNTAAGRCAARCFISHGHSHLGMLTGPTDSQNALDRTAGFRAALRAAGLPLRNEWFLPCAYDSDDGARAAHLLLSLPSTPTAIFCASDEIALGALRAIRELGLSCPRDVSLIGFDNAHATAHTSPPLTTFAQPFEQLAALTADAVHAFLSGSPAPSLRSRNVHFIERFSVAPPPR